MKYIRKIMIAFVAIIMMALMSCEIPEIATDNGNTWKYSKNHAQNSKPASHLTHENKVDIMRQRHKYPRDIIHSDVEINYGVKQSFITNDTGWSYNAKLLSYQKIVYGYIQNGDKRDIVYWYQNKYIHISDYYKLRYKDKNYFYLGRKDGSIETKKYKDTYYYHAKITFKEITDTNEDWVGRCDFPYKEGANIDTDCFISSTTPYIKSLF